MWTMTDRNRAIGLNWTKWTQVDENGLNWNEID